MNYNVKELAMETKQLNIAELIEQMPATDSELDALKAQQQPVETDNSGKAKKKKTSTTVGGGSKFTGPDPELADKICDQILSGGRECLVELIGTIRHTGDPEFKNYKAEYLAHCLVLFVGRPGKESQRRLLMNVFAEQAINEILNKAVRGFLVRELQWIGDKSIAPQLSALLQDDELCAFTVSMLSTIGTDDSEVMRNAVTKAKGKNRLLLIQNLAALKDPKAVDLLRQAADDEDRDIRLSALWGLANLVDASSVDRLLKAADTDVNYERIKNTQACLLLAENLSTAGKNGEAAKIYTHLRDTRKDKSEKYIRDLADKALAKIS